MNMFSSVKWKKAVELFHKFIPLTEMQFLTAFVFEHGNSSEIIFIISDFKPTQYIIGQ